MIDPFALMVGLVVALVLVFGVQWWRAAPPVARRKLRAVPGVAIGGLRPGERVKVSGRVVLRQALASPLRDARCGYWAARVQERVSKNHWATRADVWEAVPFWLEDPTGRVYVDPGSEKLSLETSRTGSSGWFDDPGPNEARFLERVGLPPTNVVGMNRNLRYDEASLDEGEQVAVIGTVAVVEVDGEPALALLPGDEGLVISDDPGVHG